MVRTGQKDVALMSAPAIHASRQLITLAVDHRCGRGETGLLLPLLTGVKGIEAIASDPLSVRVWVFGNGTLEPATLVDALASWGYESCVLEDQLTVSM